MFEIIFILVFVATLLVTGVTMFTIFAATGLALFVMTIIGMLGAAMKLLPWIVVIVLGVWFFKKWVYQPRHQSRR